MTLPCIYYSYLPLSYIKIKYNLIFFGLRDIRIFCFLEYSPPSPDLGHYKFHVDSHSRKVFISSHGRNINILFKYKILS